jgi:citrate lyase beta subunit
VTGFPRLSDADRAAVDSLVAPADEKLTTSYPGDRGERQPVHTVYVPADRVTPDITTDWGKAARAALEEHAATATGLAAVTGARAAAVEQVWPRLLAKLDTEPVEDLRIDLEDGYGVRADAEEDRHAEEAARALALAHHRGAAPAYWGVRFKSLEAATRGRGLRSLDIVLGAVLDAGVLPDGFVLTLPKVSSVEQVRGMVEACDRLETAYGLRPGRLSFEVQVEMPQAVIDAEGRVGVARLIHAAGGRCSALVFGTYDYTAALGVAAAYQAMDHPAAEHAKQTMAVAAAGTGVRLSDGSTNVLPVGDRTQVHTAWQLHAWLVDRALRRGFYQGWDLHPAQLVTRYVASYAFFRTALPAAAGRLAAYLERSDSGVLDEPATARALASVLLRGLDCGAVDADEIRAAGGPEETLVRKLSGRRPGEH